MYLGLGQVSFSFSKEQNDSSFISFFLLHFVSNRTQGELRYQTQRIKGRENGQTLRLSSGSPESAFRKVVFPEAGGPRSRVILKSNKSIDESHEVSSKTKIEHHTSIPET